MSNVSTLDEVDDVFADIPAAVAHAFEGTRRPYQVKHTRDRAWVFHHVGHALTHDALVFAIDVDVLVGNLDGRIDVHACESIQGTAQHLLDQDPKVRNPLLYQTLGLATLKRLAKKTGLDKSQ